MDGVTLESILRQAPAPPQHIVAAAPAAPPRHRVSFADEVDEMGGEPPSYLGGLVDKNNYYMIMLESLRPAFIAGILVALLQIDLIKSFVVSNISGVMSPNLSMYGFFVFVVIGAVAFKLADMTSKPANMMLTK